MAQLILVRDDVEDNRVVFWAALEHAGHAVLLAETGAEALEQARHLTPSLILLDLMMLGMTGWETVPRPESDPVTGDIPVVAVTADVHTTAAELDQAGFCAFIGKPVLPRHLLDAVAQCLAYREAGGTGWLKLPSCSAAQV
jgi:CheY-like chemotaxis protein